MLCRNRDIVDRSNIGSGSILRGHVNTAQENTKADIYNFYRESVTVAFGHNNS